MVNIKAILGIASVGLMLVTMYEQNKAITHYKNEVRALKNTIQKQDSINANQYSELFQTQSQAGRYEVALELFKEKNKKAADEFELILATQTE